jgi:pepF/M3 family oligoendopeptidase
MMTPLWRLDQLYSGLDDRQFMADEERFRAELSRAVSWFDREDIGEGDAFEPTVETVERAADALKSLNDLSAVQRKMRAYIHARVTTDARDDDAGSAYSRLLPASGDLMRLNGRFAAWVGRAAGPIDGDHTEVTAHREFIRQCSITAEHRMTDAEEDLALSLGLTGGTAWVRMRNDVAGRMTADVDGIDGPVPLAMVRGMATSPDSRLRDRAFDAEIEMWERNAVPFAAALNAHKGESITLNDRRGWPDDLAPVLAENGIDAEILDAMTREVVASLPVFRRFMQRKADLLHRPEGLRWADLVAPVGDASSNAVTWDQAVTRVSDSFGSFSPALARLATTAFADSWVDAVPRDGKQGGAYCMPVEGAVSRVFMNFDGSADSVQTLAHELGHAFHNSQLADRTELQRRTPRSLAETASIFCETIVVESLLADADPALELALLNTDLSGSNQVVVDIHSRFLFESELYRQRRKSTLSIDELNELMVESQDISYGNGLAEGSRHRYMWAVKPHYFTPFYNFPYTFGLLFGLGLYDRFRSDPETFRAGYDDLLSSTGMAPAAELASAFSIDLADPGFWRSSLSVIADRVERFIELADAQAR